jgi:hypothetical protein
MDNIKKILQQQLGENKYKDTGREKPSAIEDLKQGQYLKALQSISEPIDSYLGVPYRQAAMNLAETASKDSSPMDYLKAVGSGLMKAGSDPQAAPSGADVAEKILPGDDNVLLKTALATGMDIADLGSLIPGSKLASKGALLGGTIKKIDKIPIPKKSTAELLRDKIPGKPLVIDTEAKRIDMMPQFKKQTEIKPSQVSAEDVESARDFVSPTRFGEIRKRFGLEDGSGARQRSPEEIEAITRENKMLEAIKKIR